VSPSADYDLYLRIAREYPVYNHGEVIAEYRRHGTNMTRDPASMLTAVVTVLRRQRPHVRRKRQYKEAYSTGMRFWHEHYGEPLVEKVRMHEEADEWRYVVQDLFALLRYYPYGFVGVSRNLLRLPNYVRYQIQSWRQR
jgi:hypothetical protein